MKKTASLLLMGLLLFNWFGYQILYTHLQSVADYKLETQLDEDKYKESDLISIKLPLFSPYITDESSFKRVDGEVNIDGVQYKYVKRKVFHDSLILLCVRNNEKMKLKNASNDYFKTINDIQSKSSNKSKNGHGTLNNLLVEFEIKDDKWQLDALQNNSMQNSSFIKTSYSFTFVSVCEQPPDTLASLA